MKGSRLDQMMAGYPLVGQYRNHMDSVEETYLSSFFLIHLNILCCTLVTKRLFELNLLLELHKLQI